MSVKKENRETIREVLFLNRWTHKVTGLSNLKLPKNIFKPQNEANAGNV